jgi:hypothetical protein
MNSAHIEFSHAQTCRLLGISKAHLGRLVKAGVVPKLGPDAFDPFTANRAFLAHRAVGEGPKRRIDEQKAVKLERENRVAARTLMPTSEALDAVDFLCLIFKNWTRALPGRIASVAANAEPAVLREAVRVECARVVEELAKAAAANDFAAGPADAPPFDEVAADGG